MSGKWLSIWFCRKIVGIGVTLQFCLDKEVHYNAQFQMATEPKNCRKTLCP